MNKQHEYKLKWNNLNPHKLRFQEQRASARRRKIEWHFTLEQWIEWWGEDFDRRGKTKDSLCMGRFGDIGPYTPDNCYKSTIGANIRLEMIRRAQPRN